MLSFSENLGERGRKILSAVDDCGTNRFNDHKVNNNKFLSIRARYIDD